MKGVTGRFDSHRGTLGRKQSPRERVYKELVGLSPVGSYRRPRPAFGRGFGRVVSGSVGVGNILFYLTESDDSHRLINFIARSITPSTDLSCSEDDALLQIRFSIYRVRLACELVLSVTAPAKFARHSLENEH